MCASTFAVIVDDMCVKPLYYYYMIPWRIADKFYCWQGARAYVTGKLYLKMIHAMHGSHTMKCF